MTDKELEKLIARGTAKGYWRRKKQELLLNILIAMPAFLALAIWLGYLCGYGR